MPLLTAFKIRLFSSMLFWCIFTGTSICHAHVNAESIPVVAEMEYRIYVDLNPNDLELRNKYGMLLLNRNKISEAENQFTFILGKAPKNFDALDALGLIRTKQQRYPEAVKLFQEAVAVNSKDVLVFFHLGSALEATGQIQEALKAYETALALKNQRTTPATAKNNAEEDFIQGALNNLRTKISMTNQKQKRMSK